MNELNELKKLAQEKAVSFEISYEEPSDTWFGFVSSAAPTEQIEIKKTSLENVISRIKEHLEKL